MIFSVLILLTCAVNLGCSVTVELYAKQNYYGLLKKINIMDNYSDCILLDQTYEVRSIKTEKCLIAYETMDCKRIDTKLPEGSKLYSIRVERDTPHFDVDGAYSNPKEERGVQSFHLCSTEPGAGLLNVSIYSGPFYTGDLVASYEGVCKCKNIPSYITLKGKPFSIDNHGKNMYFYDKEDCTGQERLIPAGDNERSRSVTHLDPRAVVIRSFRLADDLPCPNLDALVYYFKISSGKSENRIIQNTTYTRTNREPIPVTEYININALVSVEYSVAKAFTNIHSTRVKTGFGMDNNEYATGWLSGFLDRSIQANYQYPPDTNQSTPTIVTRLLSIPPSRMPFDKPACTKCTANISLTLQRFPVIYTAEAVVTGVAGDDKMSPEQIRHYLPPGMKYVKEYDDYSVVVAVEGEMKGSHDTYSSQTSCVLLPDCKPNLRVDL